MTSKATNAKITFGELQAEIDRANANASREICTACMHYADNCHCAENMTGKPSGWLQYDDGSERTNLYVQCFCYGVVFATVCALYLLYITS